MDLNTFHKIDEELTSNEVAQLKFLCMDLIPKKRLDTVTDAKDLFLRMEEQALLDDGLLVPELLVTIGRFDLLGILGMSKEDVQRKLLQCDRSRIGVSAYRKMLFGISEQMTAENLRSVKFLVDLPRSKLGTSSTLLDVMIEMEKLQRLGEDNLDELYSVLDKCDKQMACRIEEYRTREQGGRLPLREVFGSAQVSLPVESRQRYQMETGTGLRESLFTDAEPEPTQEAYYNMTRRPLGYCLIINNYNFKEKSSLNNRTGTNKDRDDLIRVFHRMHFVIEVQDDLTASEIKELIKEFAKKDHSQMGAFVCCVLSHGQKGAVLGVDAQGVEIREITKPFGECHTLASKPKLFFIQACQGSKGQNGVLAEDSAENAPEEEYEGDAYNPAYRFIPIEADMLIGMATVEHYQAFRHTINGSIYIQELCKQLENLCPRGEDILSILTKVNHEVSLKRLTVFKQMPEPRYTLTKKLVLPMD